MKPSKQPAQQVIARGAQMLAAAGVATPAVDARLIAAWLLDDTPMNVLFLDVDQEFETAFEAAIQRRASREPLQHIVGAAPFGPLTLRVGLGVFIPRPETEVLADWAVKTLQQSATSQAPTVVDLGTGSGALALYIAHAAPCAEVIAVERSEAAREYAQRNRDELGLNVRIVEGDMTDHNLLSTLHGTVDMVVSNPPYVPNTDGLDPEVYVDPPEAVFSGDDGMDAIRGLVPVAAALLKPGGVFAVEHDDATSDLTVDAVTASGTFERVERLADLTGKQRFVCARKRSE
ncbi:peptide chain release factor N(5)-glutamine methyltransferase [Corynebacterium pseudogenitalium]|uniref:peptide chain release factor N(5)-glutamine methyltransferase n=1 Tax=Corynebacterium pseudogenitalium TaxID=38303 RepID=UPI003BA03619